VTFDEDATLKKSRRCHLEDVKPYFPQFVKITILAKNCGKLKNLNV
jgi:hypothetical protein